MLEKITELELVIGLDTKSKKALKSIKGLLEYVDLSTEVIPIRDATKMENLLTHLKGCPLTKDELKMVENLISN